MVGDFSLINPNVVRVKGFSCDWLGLRVFRDSRLGLRVRSPGDHVILLIPLYLTWGVFAVPFPPSSPLPHH